TRSEATGGTSVARAAPYSLRPKSGVAFCAARERQRRRHGTRPGGHPRPLVQHVVEAALNSLAFERVLVATDDERIAEAVARFGGDVELTSAAHRSGTDRVAEVVGRLPAEAPEVVVNLQGDEPMLDGASLQRLVRAFTDVRVAMATLVRPLEDPAERLSPHVVKVVPDVRGDALYFSRADIPFDRDGMRVPR